MSEQVGGSHNNYLPGWRQQQQKEFGVDVSERNELSTKHPTALEHLQYHRSPVQTLPGYPEIMAFPADNNLLPHHMIQHYFEQSELEERGGIDPFKLDADAELDRSQGVQAEKYIDSYPVLLLMDSDEGKKPPHGVYKPLHNALKSCNVDFSDLWMWEVDLQNNSAVPSSVSSCNDENDYNEETTTHQHRVDRGDPANISSANITCMVCYDGRVEYVLLPCGHTVCQRCAMLFKASAQPCPFCRVTLSGITRIFL